jgi:hypothetical protein
MSYLDVDSYLYIPTLLKTSNLINALPVISDGVIKALYRHFSWDSLVDIGNVDDDLLLTPSA